VQHRNEFKAQYKDAFNETLGVWRRTLNNDSGSFNQRIMQNWCHLFTCYSLMGKYHKLPISNEAFEDYCKSKAVQWSNFIRSSDTLSEFWNTFAFLVDQNVIVEGWDFKIESVLQIKLYDGKKDGKPQDHIQTFNEPTKILFLRLNNVHKHYQQAYRSRTGKEGMTIENLKHYFSGRKYFLGNNNQSQFKRFVVKSEESTVNSIRSVDTRRVPETSVSSSCIFLYDQLGIDIERNQPEREPEQVESGGDTIPF
jgi:hypothetical protein